MFAERLDRVRTAMGEQGVDVLLLSVGADLPWVSGYEAMPLERLTMLVIPRDGEATMVIPRLEAPRVVERPEVFGLRPWGETEDPVEIVAELAGRPARAAIGDTTWARFLVELIDRMPETKFGRASAVTGPLRARKDPAELAALRAAGAAADRVAVALQAGEIPLIGRSEADVSAELTARLLAEGHSRVNFAIVASGPNGASPHHHASSKVIEPGEAVVCDFGGVLSLDDHTPGYCSDITRTVFTGEPPAEFRELYAALLVAQAAGVAAGEIGAPCEEVDRITRRIIADAGYGERFIHRTGHGIGIEEHEDPYIVEGNRTPLEAGHAYSVEPGIYIPGRWGARLEDIVLATSSGPEPVTFAEHDLVIVEA